VLSVVNALLLDHDDLCACVYWNVYGAPLPAGLPRLYRFEIAYRAPGGGDTRNTEEGPPETAWQRYISGWREDSALRNAPLDEGLCLLWAELH